MNTTTIRMHDVHQRVKTKVSGTTKATIKSFWPANHKDAPLTAAELNVNEGNSTPKLI